VRDADLLVVGGGVAGLSAALTAAEAGAEVVLLSKGSLVSSNSYVAQGVWGAKISVLPANR
jgi:L-aspartate oxidase